MGLIERIQLNGECLAIIYHDYIRDGVTFFPLGEFSQLLGYMMHRKGGAIQEHVHKMSEIYTRIKRALWPINLRGLARLHPISRLFGYDRGQPIDRYYIENFLLQHKSDVHGRVLEIGDNTYTKKFGGTRVDQSDVLHAVEGNPSATIVADLAQADNIPQTTYQDPDYQVLITVRAKKTENGD